MCILTSTFDLDANLDLTDALADDLTAVKCSVIVLCNLHTRKMILSFPCCRCCPLLLCAAPLPLQCCTSATGGWLCNHWVRLHSCTLPRLLLKLAWVEEFKLSLSLCLELASLGYLGLGSLGTLNKFPQ